MSILRQGFFGIVIAFVLLFVFKSTFNWKIEVPLINGKTEIIENEIINGSFLEFHPFFRKLEKTVTTTNRLEFYITEEATIVGPIKNTLRSFGVIEKKDSKFFLNVALNVFGIFKCDFKATMSYDHGMLTEEVDISGPILPSFMVKFLAFPCHEILMKKFAEVVAKK